MFMWKKRIHIHLIYERLDRAVVCKDWLNIYPESLVMHESFFICSDHCPIILSTDPLVQCRKQFPFRFQNFWRKCQQLDQIVIPQWKTQVEGTRM